jgi:hypothetical protein
MVKLQFDNNKQFKITLPRQILLAMGWEKGNEISIGLKDGCLVLKREKR